MSDFLSNFKSDTYKKTLNEKDQKKELKEPKETKETISTAIPQESTESVPDKPRTTRDFADVSVVGEEKLIPVTKTNQHLEESTESEESSLVTGRRSSRGETEEETEVDPTYKKRKRNKIILLSALSVIVASLLFWVYYSMSHVKVPDFTDKPVSEARTWASENKVELGIKQEFNLKKEVNTVVQQEISAGKKIKKGGKLALVVSQGADPDQVVPWPEFSKLSQNDAEAWVKENKADNLSILTEYSDSVEKGKFIRQEISNKEIQPATYRRKDNGIVYFSKGKEVFEKTIAMPDLIGKGKAEAATFVKTNEIAVTYEEVDSNDVAVGLVVSQSVPKETKIAKREAITFQISLGKAITVPNFGELTPTSATTIEGLMVNVKQTFSNNVAYGQLISQTIEAGTKLTEKDNKNITVTYSAGRPYLRSYIGKLEGDLPEAFYTDYQSKGANIRYTVYYVDSAAEKGSVVKMSAFNEYVPIDYVVSIAVSLGNLSGEQSPSANNSGKNQTGNDEGDSDEKDNPEGKDTNNQSEE